MENPMGHRCCRKCNVTKPISDFGVGDRYRCKECIRAYSKAYRASDHGKEKVKAYGYTEERRAKRRERYQKQKSLHLAELGSTEAFDSQETVLKGGVESEIALQGKQGFASCRKPSVTILMMGSDYLG